MVFISHKFCLFVGEDVLLAPESLDLLLKSIQLLLNGGVVLLRSELLVFQCLLLLLNGLMTCLELVIRCQQLCVRTKKLLNLHLLHFSFLANARQLFRQLSLALVHQFCLCLQELKLMPVLFYFSLECSAAIFNGLLVFHFGISCFGVLLLYRVHLCKGLLYVE